MSKETNQYLHDKKKRKNNPESGLSSYDKEIPNKIEYKFDPHLDPQLQCASKAERMSFEVPLVSLLTQEKVHPIKIINGFLKDSSHQSTLDSYFTNLPLEKSIEFYKHDVNWANRMILGDSLLTMNSLINKEGMAGKVQTIYFDPPYGVDFHSNFQIETSSKDIKDGSDNSLTREPEQIKAFRDTWELEIHSYLSYLRDRFLLFRELLKEEGSIFVQISDENLNLVITILQEIFGKENFFSIIPFKKTGSASNRGKNSTVAKSLPSVCDYIIWFAKNIKRIKYHQLYLKRDVKEDLQHWSNIELPDGSRRSMTPDEKITGNFPKNARVFRTISLTSQGYTKDRTVPFLFNGRTFTPPQNRHWSVSIEGLKNLVQKNRIHESTNSLEFIWYHDDFPIMPLSNMWEDTMGETSHIYVVQTNVKVIERCVLMTSDPGDIIFDPTCGSGTTAFVSEKWGRRWITCDTSRISINLAKQRLITSFYDFYKLNSSRDHFDFNYKKYPHISASIIAYDEEPIYETMYDEPEIDGSKIRITGPFTVENLSTSHLMMPINEASTDKNDIGTSSQSYIEKIIFYLEHDGLSYPKDKKLKLKDFQVYEHGFIHAKCVIDGNGGDPVAISIGPEFGDVSQFQVQQAIFTALHEQFNWLLVIGFNFDESAQLMLTHNKPDPAQLHVEMALINPDIEIEDLQKKPSGAQMFTVFGQPEIKIHKVDKQIQVELVAIDTYDPQTGLINTITPDQVCAWCVDEDFDEQSFFIHQIIFPAENKFSEKITSNLKGMLDITKLQYLTGNKSAPFSPRKRMKFAIKIIDVRGNELVNVFDLKRTDKTGGH